MTVVSEGAKGGTFLSGHYIKKAGAWLLSVCRAVADGVYRYHYVVGMQTMRLFKRIGRRLADRFAPAGQWIRLQWRRLIVLPVRRYFGKWHRLFSAVPRAWHRLVLTVKSEGVRHLFPCLGHLFRQAMQIYRQELLTVWSFVGPVAATVVLLVTVAAWTGTDFCLSLTYQGQELGYIESENTYAQAASMAKDRVVNVDDSFQVESVPKLAVLVQGRKAVLDDAQLCDAILRTAGDSIAEATGLYVDGSFVGAMESEEELGSMLDGYKSTYFDKNDTSQRAEFVQDVRTLVGLFPSQTVTDAATLKSKLTMQTVVEKTYTVVEGDTLSTIALKADMTVSELRSMNPSYASTDMVHIGDVLVIQRPQQLLQVKMIKTIKYAETIDYTTQYVNNADKPVTYSAVKTKGQEGSQDVVAEVTYIDGVEETRKVISKTVTKQPVTKVVERGTKKVISQGGTTVIQGDGVSTGSMQWPVPVCHNYSRGFGRGHSGLDICNGPVTVRNRPAVAADGGTVIFAGWNYGYGNYVKIQHANGLCTAYGHLNSISVVKGQSVSRGQQIGLIGSTGQSSGPHLHFEVIRNGARVNPLNYVRP